MINVILIFKRGRKIRKGYGGFAFYTATSSPTVSKYIELQQQDIALLKARDNIRRSNMYLLEQDRKKRIEEGTQPKISDTLTERQSRLNDSNGEFYMSESGLRPKIDLPDYDLEEIGQIAQKATNELLNNQISKVEPVKTSTKPRVTPKSPIPAKTNTSKTTQPTVKDETYFVNKANKQLRKLGFKVHQFKTLLDIKDFLESLGFTGKDIDGNFGNKTYNTVNNNRSKYLDANGKFVVKNNKLVKQTKSTNNQPKNINFSKKDKLIYMTPEQKLKKAQWYKTNGYQVSDSFYKILLEQAKKQKKVINFLGYTLFKSEAGGLYKLNKNGIYEIKIDGKWKPIYNESQFK